MRTIAWVLILAGIALCLVGVGGAVSQIAGVYSGTMADPLGKGPEGTEVRDSMLTWVYVGLAGVPVGIAGAYLRSRARLRARRSWPTAGDPIG